jgi:hypothetical protein
MRAVALFVELLKPFRRDPRLSDTKATGLAEYNGEETCSIKESI